MNRGHEKVSKAALFGFVAVMGLLDPAPATYPKTAERSMVSALEPAEAPSGFEVATHRPVSSSCTNPRRELRFEMIRSEAEAYSPPPARPVCLAVYRP